MKAGITATRHENGDGGVPLVASSGSYMDEDIYGSGKTKFEDYVTSIAANDEAEADDDDYEATTLVQNKRATYTAPTSFLNELVTTDKVCMHCYKFLFNLESN
ncbi:splicing factor 3B subunit 1-like [Centruroides sculpturatus]|uniref:splicing factor 3B subunit 1-like n=1 Tax=Centruroides sculpturatus TaxID=218467 RepID=UPI000C6E4C41|nr:splicing factor 3B subunit 1-like [Centruroides sculpturatus]